MHSFDTYYHIFNHANGEGNLFREARNYRCFLEKYHKHVGPVAETIAWCLMPNHFHLLVKIKSEAEGLNDKLNFISKQFANFFSSYTQSFNKVCKRRGSLFIKNFKRKEIVTENYLSNLVMYIHLNPVHHGFSKQVWEWEWTSYDCFALSEEELLVLLLYTLIGEYSPFSPIPLRTVQKTK